MSDDNSTYNDDDQLDNSEALTPEDAGNAPAWDSDAIRKSHLHGMYRLWFLDYASYVILERARPTYRRRPQTRSTTHPPHHEPHGGRQVQ